MNDKESTDLLVHKGKVRTDMHCHNCGRTFIATLDYSLNGNHVVECPCGHEHCRCIENGKITGERWDSRFQKVDAVYRSRWTSDSLPAQTSAAALFIRDLWLRKEG